MNQSVKDGFESEVKDQMEEAVYYDQWLQSLLYDSARGIGRVLERFPEPGELLRAGEEAFLEILTPKQAQILSEGRKKAGSAEGMREAYGKLAERGIGFVSRRQSGYPGRLLEIPDPPAGLYYRGKLPTPDAPAVAVIGARECSEYGRNVAEELGRFLGERGVEVISGMARGIDGISQRAALEAGGGSFGVLGCGVDVCYPSSNRGLYERLIGQGGILSAYPPGTQPTAQNFPPRNRIVSGLADAVVVVEARLKSGTLITVDMALEQGREVYVVPGRVTDRLSDGCNRLLRQGAEVYLGPEAFWEEMEELLFLKRIVPVRKGGKTGRTREEMGRETKERQVEQGQQERGQQERGQWEQGQSLAETGKSREEADLAAVREALDDTPKSLEEISRLTGRRYPGERLNVLLMELVMTGRARQVSARFFCRS